jgi:enoyl-CoA hydratase
MDGMAWLLVQVEKKGRVGIVMLYRPKALNALNDGLMSDVVKALEAYDADQSVGMIHDPCLICVL